MRILKGDAMAGLTFGWIVMVALGVLVAFLGGSSRADAVQLIGLRPLAGLLLVPAIYFLTRDRLQIARQPLLLLLALVALMIFQLIPLPAGLWAALPGREPVAEFLALAGYGDSWHPLSLAPDRTLNALASLVIPVCALLAAIASGFRSSTILAGVAVIGVLNAMIAILQVLGGDSSALYFYAITNDGAPVGLFANQNHSAVFSALCLLILAYLGTDRETGYRKAGARTIIGALFIVVLVAALMSGSRAGLLLALLALVTSLAMGWVALAETRSIHRPKLLRKLPKPTVKLLMGVGLVLFAGLLFGFMTFGSNPAASSISDPESFDDMRLRILPALFEMLRTFWLPGAGFGAFEESYHIFEQDAALSRYYINQAHNDWLQFLIEGGVLGVIWLVAAVAWIVRSFNRIVRLAGLVSPRVLLWVGVAAVILLASLVDYPLRTPIFQLALAWLAVALALHRQRAPQAE